MQTSEPTESEDLCTTYSSDDRILIRGSRPEFQQIFNAWRDDVASHAGGEEEVTFYKLQDSPDDQQVNARAISQLKESSLLMGVKKVYGLSGECSGVTGELISLSVSTATVMVVWTFKNTAQIIQSLKDFLSSDGHVFFCFQAKELRTKLFDLGLCVHGLRDTQIDASCTNMIFYPETSTHVGPSFDGLTKELFDYSVKRIPVDFVSDVHGQSLIQIGTKSMHNMYLGLMYILPWSMATELYKLYKMLDLDPKLNRIAAQHPKVVLVAVDHKLFGPKSPFIGFDTQEGFDCVSCLYNIKNSDPIYELSFEEGDHSYGQSCKCTLIHPNGTTIVESRVATLKKVAKNSSARAVIEKLLPIVSSIAMTNNAVNRKMVQPSIQLITDGLDSDFKPGTPVTANPIVSTPDELGLTLTEEESAIIALRDEIDDLRRSMAEMNVYLSEDLGEWSLDEWELPNFGATSGSDYSNETEGDEPCHSENDHEVSSEADISTNDDLDHEEVIGAKDGSFIEINTLIEEGVDAEDDFFERMEIEDLKAQLAAVNAHVLAMKEQEAKISSDFHEANDIARIIDIGGKSEIGSVTSRLASLETRIKADNPGVSAKMGYFTQVKRGLNKKALKKNKGGKVRRGQRDDDVSVVKATSTSLVCCRTFRHIGHALTVGQTPPVEQLNMFYLQFTKGNPCKKCIDKQKFVSNRFNDLKKSWDCCKQLSWIKEQMSTIDGKKVYEILGFDNPLSTTIAQHLIDSLKRVEFSGRYCHKCRGKVGLARNCPAFLDEAIKTRLIVNECFTDSKEENG